MSKIVFSDFDGTLTNKEGRMTPLFFDLLDLVEDQGSELIIVSGRSISWGHFFLSHFPINYVIMEGGGVILSKKIEDGIVVIEEEFLVSNDNLDKLDKLEKYLIDVIKDCPVSKDSWGRKSDRALEIHTVKDEKQKEWIKRVIFDNGANYSISSVHLNYWFGDITKYKAIQYFAKNYQSNLDLDSCYYFGDALNDQSVFKEFKLSIGVSNIKDHLSKMNSKPKIILEGTENEGISGVYNYLKELS
jgi:HAD superfamily hydrolase (TIGR01484 family)